MYSCAISAFFIFILILSRLRIVKILSSTSKLFRFFFSLLGSGLNRESKYLNIVYFLSRDFFFFFYFKFNDPRCWEQKKKNEYIYETAFYTFRIVFTRNIVETFCEKMKRIKSRFSVHRRHDLLHSEDVRASHDGSIKWTASPSILVRDWTFECISSNFSFSYYRETIVNVSTWKNANWQGIKFSQDHILGRSTSYMISRLNYFNFLKLN